MKHGGTLAVLGKMFLVLGVLQSVLREISQVNCQEYYIFLNQFSDSMKVFWGKKRNIKHTQKLFYLLNRAQYICLHVQYLKILIDFWP